MKVTDFKVGDRVKFISEGYGRFGQEAFVVEYYNSCGEEFLSVVFDNQTTLQTSEWYPFRFEIISKAEHPNQKLANEVAEILRDAADEFLVLPNNKPPKVWKTYNCYEYSNYSCCASWYSAESKGWSYSKRSRVLDRFLRSLGVNPQQFGQIPNDWPVKKQQQTRHAWLYIAAQFAEENPDLVPTYGKKKVKV